MPLYEYECDACGHRFEKIQKFSDALEHTCPKCGGVVHKLMSSPAIKVKGRGFSINDYTRKGSQGEGGTHEKTEKPCRPEKNGPASASSSPSSQSSHSQSSNSQSSLSS